MADTLYRLSFEVVGQAHLYLYCNANPTFYKNVTQIVPNSEIPDEHWHQVSKEDSNPWQQYNTLRQWEAEDRGFVRNVRLERQVSTPEWEPVEGPPASPEATPDDCTFERCLMHGGTGRACSRCQPSGNPTPPEPTHGRPVRFEVRYRPINVSNGWRRNMEHRYVVGLAGSDGDGFSHHTTFETACARALTRARRFEAAYSKPRPVARRPRLEIVGGAR